MPVVKGHTHSKNVIASNIRVHSMTSPGEKSLIVRSLFRNVRIMLLKLLQSDILKPLAAGNTPVSGLRFETSDNITVHVVPRKHF